MEPVKMVLGGIVVALVAVGLLLGASFLFLPVSGGDDGGSSGPTLTKTTTDTDLLSLGLQVPSTWSFEMSDGSALDFDDLRGVPVVVMLMATWCSSCGSQNGNLESLYDNVGDQVEILSLSIDASETTSMLADYKSTKGLPWQHGLDSGSSFMYYFSVTSIPTLVMIDGDGFFRFLHIGLWSEAQMLQTLASILQ